MTLTLPMKKSEEFDLEMQKVDQKSQNKFVGKKQAWQVHFAQLHIIWCQDFHKKDICNNNNYSVQQDNFIISQWFVSMKTQFRN